MKHKMNKVKKFTRLADVGELEEKLRERAEECERKDDGDSMYSVAITCEICDLKSLPTINPDFQWWHDSVLTPPTETDADKFGNIIVWAAAAKHVDVIFWQNVLCYPMDLPFWMPCPKQPEESGNE